ncbi:MAG: hypothetical protein EP299_13920 [Acidobacteria bacterium]|nr:MAG: hypothetical protein EP299_13920 [Acidobacteriota bacterium]
MTARGQRKTHRIRRLLLAVVGGLLLLFITLAVVGIWRLQKGPVSLGFLIPKFEEALHREISPMKVEVEDVTLALSGWRSPLDLQAREVSITQTSGDELLRLAELGIGLSFEALLRRELAVSGINARGLAVSVARAEDGTFVLDLGGTGSSGTQTGEGLGGWLNRWLDADPTTSAVGELDRVSVSQGTLELVDKGLGMTFRADAVELELSRTPTGLEATLEGILDLGEGSVELSAAAGFPRQERRLSGQVELAGLRPSMLVWTDKVPACLRALDPTIDARAGFRFGDGFDLVATDFELTGAELQATGSVDLSDQAPTISIQLTASGVEPATYAAVCEELRELDRIDFPLDAEVGLELAGKTLESLQFELTGGQGQLGVKELYSQPLSVSSALIDGHIENGFDSVHLGQARIELDDLVLEVRGSAERRGQSFRGSLEGLVDELSVQQLHALWPEDAAAGVRRWVRSSIPSGRIRDLRATFAGGLELETNRRPSIDSLEVVFAYEDLEVTFLPPQPPVTGIDGRAIFTKERFDFDVDRGELGELDVYKSQVRIAGLTSGIPMLSIHATFSGSAEPLVGVVTGEPLTIAPELLEGVTADLSEASLDLEIPLVSHDDASPIDYAATAEISNVFWPRDSAGLEVRGGEQTIKLDRQALEIRGDARFAGVPATVDYWENLGPGDPKRRVEAHARIDENGLQALGLPEQPYIAGATEVDVTVTQQRNRDLEIGATADFEQSILSIPQIGWQKPAGDAGSATVTAHRADQIGWTIDPFRIEAGDLQATGRIRMAPDRLVPREIEVDRLEIDGSHLQAGLSIDEQEGIEIHAAGSRLDLERALPAIRKWRKEAREAEEQAPKTASETPRSLSFDVDFDEMVLSQDVRLTEVSAAGFFSGRRWRNLQAAARIGAGSEASLDFRPEEGEQRLTVRATDIGGVVSELMGSQKLEAGTLRIDGSRPSPDDPVTGSFLVEDFRVLQSPTLLRLLTALTLTEPLQSLEGEGLGFRVLKGQFTLDEGRIQFTDTWADGRGLHITADGWVDPRRDVGDMSGSLAWQGRILRTLSKVPLVGRLLTGKNREGLFATRFEVAGSLDDPTVQTDVLGTLTPGFTRDVFDRLRRDRKELKAEKKAEKKSQRSAADDGLR